jgi:hypothetical protein
LPLEGQTFDGLMEPGLPELVFNRRSEPRYPHASSV